jgi:hypothetical protein
MLFTLDMKVIGYGELLNIVTFMQQKKPLLFYLVQNLLAQKPTINQGTA